MIINPLDELFAPQALSARIRTFADQDDEHTATRLFERGARPLLPIGTEVTWEEQPFHRHLAPVVGPDSPHPRTKQLTVRKRKTPLVSIKLYKDLPSSALLDAYAVHPEYAGHLRLNDLGAVDGKVQDELQDLTNLIQNTREYLAIGALLGRIEVSEQTVPGSNMAFTVEFGNGQAQALSPWSDPTTPIRSRELIRLGQLYRDQSGTRPGLALCDEGFDGQFVQNQELKSLVGKALGLEILKGPDRAWKGLGGGISRPIEWLFTDGIYKPEGGPVTRYFPEATVVVLPAFARLRSALGWAEGISFVPNGPRYTADARSATKLVQEVRGFYAYAELRNDPFGIRIYAGWRGLPVVLNPNAVLVYRTGALVGAP